MKLPENEREYVKRINSLRGLNKYITSSRKVQVLKSVTFLEKYISMCSVMSEILFEVFHERLFFSFFLFFFEQLSASEEAKVTFLLY